MSPTRCAATAGRNAAPPDRTMFRALLHNSLISAGAFLVVGLVGLLLVPVLIASYGLVGLGLIMLARMFLPVAGLGVFDFGISEISTQTVAAARVDGDWERARRRLTLLATVTTAIALAVAVALGLGAPLLARAFSVPVPLADGFVEVLRTTAWLLPMLFLSILLEGCLKGFERFRALRAAEVSSALLYAAAAVLLCWRNASFQWIVWAYLGSLVVRAVAIAVSLATGATPTLALRWRPAADDRVFVRERARIFLTSRLLGTLLHQSPGILVGLVVGPHGVGLYDTLARLPRFAKSVFGMLNTTLLPFATRLEAAGDTARMRMLAGFGLVLLPAITFPPLAAAALLSGPTLEVWLGHGLGRHAPWLALFWALPAINTVISFQSYVLMGRVDYIRASNRLTALQIVVQTALGLGLSPWLQEFAFIVGYIGASAALLFWQLSLTRRHIEVPEGVVGRLLLFSAALAAAVALGQSLPLAAWISGPAALALGYALALAAQALATAYLFLDGAARKLLGDIARLATRRASPARLPASSPPLANTES